jgi:uncharacterized protein (TIGR02996 family)
VYFERPRTVSFVEVERDGPRLLRRWGQIEKAGHQRVQTFASAYEADTAFDLQIIGLEGKGYLPGRQHPELLGAIERAPDGPGAFLVYADWLLERQDPRGELIARMSRGQDCQELLLAHPGLLPPWWGSHATLQWRLGFLAGLTFRHAEGQESPAPWTLRRILRHPSAHFVRELVLDGVAAPWPHLLATWRALLERRRPMLDRVILRGSPQLAPLVGQVRGVTAE